MGRKPAAILIVFAGLAGLKALKFGLDNWLDRVSNAWAYAQPPLLGSWQAEALTENTRMRLVITLSREKLEWSEGDNPADDHRSIIGQAMLYDSTGRAQPYSIEGIVQDRRGRETRLTLLPSVKETPGIRLNKITLSWDGDATLKGQTYLEYVDANGATRLHFSGPLLRRPAPFVLLFHRSG